MRLGVKRVRINAWPLVSISGVLQSSQCNNFRSVKVLLKVPKEQFFTCTSSTICLSTFTSTFTLLYYVVLLPAVKISDH